MTRTEARLGYLRTAAAKHGLSLGEYLALCIANEFVMGWDTVASYLGRILHDWSDEEGDADGLVAVIGCLTKRWLEVLPTGTLALTEEGRKVLRKVSD
jgi:hypothetical protein